MSKTKEEALAVLDRLHSGDIIDNADYSTIHDGLDEIDTLAERDAELEELWARFGDIPMDPDTECMEDDFLGFSRGTHREEIWHWFDERHSKGVAYLLYGAELDRDKVNKLVKLGDMSFECESTDCAYNNGGYCRFALVHDRRPVITDEDGCTEFVIKEGAK